MWYATRKTASMIFTRQRFKTLMEKTFLERSHRLVKILEASSDSGEKIDIQQKFFAFTMDSVMNIFFGRASNAIDGNFDRYGSAYDTAHSR